jgi:hypothetical protein
MDSIPADIGIKASQVKFKLLIHFLNPLNFVNYRLNLLKWVL